MVLELPEHLIYGFSKLNGLCVVAQTASLCAKMPNLADCATEMSK